RSLYGHANLYGLFTESALGLARAGGIVSYVTPTGFLAGEYFTRLRGLLHTDAPPVALDLIEHRKGVFEDVLQEALLASYRVGSSPTTVSVNVLTLADDDSLKTEGAGRFELPEVPGMPWLVPRKSGQERLLRRLRSM